MSMTFVTHAAIWALETSLAASVLILLVSGLRLAFRRHPGLSYFLGLLILARLLWPGGAIAPASSLSVLNWLEVSPRAAAFSPPDLIGLSEPSIPVTANDAASPEPPPLRWRRRPQMPCPPALSRGRSDSCACSTRWTSSAI